MKWFDEFVTETVREWVQANKKEVLKFKEYVGLMIAEALTTYELGNEGELFVKKSLTDKKYQATLSAASRTPSDVWAITDTGEYYHIMLIQVKTTEGARPAELSQDNVDELKTLSLFVLERLKESSKVPKDFSDKPIVVSIGYAGIVLSGNQARINSTMCYYLWYSTDLDNILPRIRERVEATHRLSAK